MSDNNQPKTNVIFLFGAGASVDAGIPDTYTFVIAFEEYVKQQHPDLSELLSNIVKVRERFNQRIYGKEQKKVDIEQLLDTIRRLIESENDPLLDFYDGKSFSLNVEQSNFTEIKDLLENFIRERVIIEDESKLEYLKELLKFDKPIEIYSTNYDTCIEQLSHIHHMRYTDGFDINWNKDSFGKNLDIKHYKMHGSVIWYENEKTKECVKIPVHAFLEGKPVALKLIYGEAVKPLLIYPAQKSEYVEPLTDLQLMFKKRLFNRATKFLVVVGYSFRDNYIIHMLWDAARVNEDLHVILIAPNAKQIFEEKLKYINKKTEDLSRIHDRVICLPYLFEEVLYQLKNHYLNNLEQILRSYNDSLEKERFGQEANWDYIVRMCIDVEFLTKALSASRKAKKPWGALDWGTRDKHLLFEFKALLHSIICEDGYESLWLNLVNDTLEISGVKNLAIIDQKDDTFFFGFEYMGLTFKLTEILEKWICAVQNEVTELVAFHPSIELKIRRLLSSLYKLEDFYRYIKGLSMGVNWRDYEQTEGDSPRVNEIISRLLDATIKGKYSYKQLKAWSLEIEKGRLKSFLGAESFKFSLT